MCYIILSILIFCSLHASSCVMNGEELDRQSLILAVKKGTLEDIKSCLREGAMLNSVDVHHSTPLHWACFLDKGGAIIEELLQAGAKIDSKDVDGWIPLDWAYKKSNISAMKQLIQKAIDLKNLKLCGYDGKTLLHYAAVLEDEESSKIVQRLLVLSLDPNARDSYGCTPLHYAVCNNKIVACLLKAGAFVNVKNNDGCTPLDLAQRKDVILSLELAIINPNALK